MVHFYGMRTNKDLFWVQATRAIDKSDSWWQNLRDIQCKMTYAYSSFAEYYWHTFNTSGCTNWISSHALEICWRSWWSKYKTYVLFTLNSFYIYFLVWVTLVMTLRLILYNYLLHWLVHSLFFLWCPWAQQLSWDVLVVASDVIAVLKDTIEGTVEG